MCLCGLVIAEKDLVSCSLCFSRLGKMSPWPVVNLVRPRPSPVDHTERASAFVTSRRARRSVSCARESVYASCMTLVVSYSYNYSSAAITLRSPCLCPVVSPAHCNFRPALYWSTLIVLGLYMIIVVIIILVVIKTHGKNKAIVDTIMSST